MQPALSLQIEDVDIPDEPHAVTLHRVQGFFTTVPGIRCLAASKNEEVDTKCVAGTSLLEYKFRK